METHDFSDFEPEPLPAEKVEQALAKILAEHIVIRIEGLYLGMAAPAFADMLERIQRPEMKN